MHPTTSKQDINVGGTTYGYSCNAAKRLSGVTQNGSPAGAYAYDFAGQRVWRQTFGGGAAETAYIYDADGHLLAEHDATNGDVKREYVWLDDLPVALLDIAGMSVATNFIHTGQIDEPQMVTDSGQAIVWDATTDPYGIATISVPGTTLDMRLPGQSLQLEAGNLHQNRWRDYDPSLGRYVEADPFGIDAGQNIYAYVDGDPLNLVDPDGRNYKPLGEVPGCGSTPPFPVVAELGERFRTWCITVYCLLTWKKPPDLLKPPPPSGPPAITEPKDPVKKP